MTPGMNAGMSGNGRPRRPLCINCETPLIERLEAFGLVEADGLGGWRLTEHCEAGLAALGETYKLPAPPSHAGAVRPWVPRRL
jgi:hypothetical protein